MVMEVTERPADRSRVASTFRSKIAPTAADYVFVVHLTSVDNEALRQAERYFMQGYELDFVDLQTWVRDILVTLGSEDRRVFQDEMIDLLSGPDVPRMTKLVWNEALQTVL